MSKEMKKTWILSTIVCLIPILIGILLYNKMPEQIATHWGADGTPNGWSSRFTGVIVFPGSLVVLNLIFPFLLKVDPKYTNMSEKIKCLLHWIIPAVAVFASGTTLAAALGAEVKVEFMTPMFMGLLFTIIGNYLPKMSQTYTVGIKLPWTLADEENWNRTHRFAGYLWVVCGLLIMVGAFTPIRGTIAILLAVLMVLGPTVYSYLYFAGKIH